ncbi:unnamed protein product [Closterium sp. Naga37s-1]|nr:unnamed protein product [Closterium sp. Naga37s-1]
MRGELAFVRIIPHSLFPPFPSSSPSRRYACLPYVSPAHIASSSSSSNPSAGASGGHWSRGQCHRSLPPSLVFPPCCSVPTLPSPIPSSAPSPSLPRAPHLPSLPPFSPSLLSLTFLTPSLPLFGPCPLPSSSLQMENEPLVGRIIDDLGLHDRVVLPQEQSKRYIVKNGKPTLLPGSLPEFLTTPLLSLPAKLRMLAEPLLWKRLPPGSNADEESVRSFLERHVGPEPVDYIVDPFCAGTTGSNPNDLLMKHAFHEVWELEQQHGSLLLGMVKTQMAKAKARKQQAKQQGSTSASSSKALTPRPKGVSFSFQSGMQELPLSLAAHIPASALRLSHRVDSLSCDLHSPPHRSSWSLSVTRVGDGDSGGKGKGGRKEEGSERFDAVVVTAPLSALANMPFKLSGQPQKLSIQLPVYQSMALLVNAFREEDVSSALPGFGVLVPTKEAASHQFKTLGTLFSSAMFPQRAPKGTVLLTSFVGGSRFKNLRSASVEQLNAMALADLQRLLGVKAKPIFSSHMVWHDAFPELTHGYGGVLESMRKIEATTPFFYWAGNHRDGLAVGKALVGGYRAAERVLADLEATGGRHLFTMARQDSPPVS